MVENGERGRKKMLSKEGWAEYQGLWTVHYKIVYYIFACSNYRVGKFPHSFKDPNFCEIPFSIPGGMKWVAVIGAVSASSVTSKSYLVSAKELQALQDVFYTTPEVSVCPHSYMFSCFSLVTPWQQIFFLDMSFQMQALGILRKTPFPRHLF